MTTNMVEDKYSHGVFLINPIDLKSLTEKFVKVTLLNGEILTGTLYTIDPVSQSLILINKEESGNFTLKITLNHSVNSVEVLPEIPQEQLNITVEDIFKSNTNVSLNVNTKEDVKDWLIKNMVPVMENGDKLVIDSLEIYPPYGVDQCYSDNSIVLTRIKNLLSQMPAKNLT